MPVLEYLILVIVSMAFVPVSADCGVGLKFDVFALALSETADVMRFSDDVATSGARETPADSTVVIKHLVVSFLTSFIENVCVAS